LFATVYTSNFKTITLYTLWITFCALRFNEILIHFKCLYNSKANVNNVRIMAICPGPTFDGFKDDADGKKHLEQKLKVYITSGEENPNPNRVILVQRRAFFYYYKLLLSSLLLLRKSCLTCFAWFYYFSIEYIKNAFLHVMKNGKTGDVWIAENEESPRLSNVSYRY